MSHLPAQYDDPARSFLTNYLSSNTRAAYEKNIAAAFKHWTLPVDLTACHTITRDHIIAYRDHLIASGKSPSTVNQHLSALSKFFGCLAADNYIAKNPCAFVIRPKRSPLSSTSPLSESQIRALLRAMDAEKNPLLRSRDHCILLLGLGTGLRRSEYVHICLQNVERREVNGKVWHLLRLNHTKSGVPETVILTPESLSALREYVEIYESRFGKMSDTEPLFRAFPQNGINAGKPLSGQSINKMLQKYARIAGIPGTIFAHVLRHTCCTLAVENGALMQKVQSHLRHQSLQTTQRYFHERDKFNDNAAGYIPDFA